VHREHQGRHHFRFHAAYFEQLELELKTGPASTSTGRHWVVKVRYSWEEGVRGWKPYSVFGARMSLWTVTWITWLAASAGRGLPILPEAWSGRSWCIRCERIRLREL
jgi:hypothetical protein